MTHRFFVRPGSIERDQVTFERALAHQLRNVLRLRPGARVIVLDDTGQEYDVELTDLQRDRAQGRVRAQRQTRTEPRLSLTLYQSALKRSRFEWVLQKGTELGVSAFVPLITARTIATDAGRLERKRDRWERIIREAAEQSHRGRVPRLAPPLSFAEACQDAAATHDLALVPWEGAAQGSLPSILRPLAPRPDTVALLVGPEGGLTRGEVALAQGAGVRVVTLGPRILRAETAGLAAATIVMSELGEMGT